MKKISLVLSLLASVLFFSCESEEDKVGPCEAYEPFDFEVVVTNNDDYAWDFEMWYIEMMKEDFLMECVAEVSTKFEDGSSGFEASTGETIRKRATGAGINGQAEVRFRANVLEGGEIVTTVSDGEVLYFTIDGSGDLSMTSSGGDYPYDENDPSGDGTGDEGDDSTEDPTSDAPPNISWIDYYTAAYNVRDYCETSEGLGHRANVAIRYKNFGGPLDNENYQLLIEFYFDTGNSGSYYSTIGSVRDDVITFEDCFYYGASGESQFVELYCTVIDLAGNSVSDRSSKVTLHKP